MSITRGRPLSDENRVVGKLEPYLKSGLSLYRACIEAGIDRSVVYDHMARSAEFTDRIHRLQNYLSIVTSNAIVRELFTIIQKQNSQKQLTNEDLNFLKWFALNSQSTQEEFGSRSQIVSTFDPEAELHILLQQIEENTSNKTTSEQLAEAKA